MMTTTGARFQCAALFLYTLITGLGVVRGQEEGSWTSIDVGIHDLTGILALGDFNSDKNADIVRAERKNSKSTIHVLVWDEGEYIQRAQIGLTGVAVSAIAADFNDDGVVDILTGHIGSANTVSATTVITHDIHFGKLSDGGRTITYKTKENVLKSVDELTLFDANGDMLVDLFGTNQERFRAYWTNDGSGEFVESHVKGELAPIAYPHSHGVADINGDCLGDLLVTTTESGDGGSKFIEIWMAKKDLASDDPFLYEKVPDDIRLPAGAGQPVYGDMDADGTIDIVVPICYPANNCELQNGLKIFFNSQKPMCSNMWESGSSCRSQSALCEASDFTFTDRTIQFNLPMSKTAGAAFSNPKTAPYSVPRDAVNRALIGDYDADGFSDVFYIAQTEFGNEGILLHNVLCDRVLCNNNDIEKSLRTLSIVENTAMSSVRDAYVATWIDIGEEGNLDLMMLTSAGAYAFLNSEYRDSFFLKTLGLNGNCLAWCDDEPKFPDPKPYGAVLPGGTFKFTVTNLDGVKSPRIASQLSQTSHLSLLTPYSYSGVGRTNNYIEELFFGTTAGINKIWICIVPNSQLVVSPYPRNEPLQWSLELYVNPGEKLVEIIISILATLAAFGLTVAFFSWRENLEDQREKRSMNQAFSFDTL